MISCSSKTQVTVCQNIDSLSLAVGTMSGGVEGLSDQVEGELDSNISDGLVLLDSVGVEAPSGLATPIASLKRLLSDARSAFDAVDWNLSAAQTSPRVQAAVTEFSADEVVSDVASVTDYVNTICRSGDSIDSSGDGLGTLPTPTVVTPPITDPPTGVVDNGSDARAIGTEVANTFGITATDAQVVCLGTKLQDVVDTSGASSSSAEYNRQFQAAFDACGIKFTIPGS